MAVDKHHDLLRPCCHNRDPSWRTSKTIPEYWNGVTIQRLRSNLLMGIRDSSCAVCWEQEDRGQLSLRQSVLQSRTIDIRQIHTPILSQVKLVTGSTCNLG